VTRSQALTIGVLSGFVVLVFTAMIILVFFDPFQQLSPPPSPPQPPSPTPIISPTPTAVNFLPTASEVTPTTSEPTATNTRVPTVTSRPPTTPTPTFALNLPTLVIRRDTPTPELSATLPPPPPLPTNTPAPPPTAVIPRQYSISFSAEETTLEEGECTDLEWRTTGISTIMLDGRQVEPSGDKEVCPERDTVYTLTIQAPGTLQFERRTVEISIIEATNTNNNDDDDN